MTQKEILDRLKADVANGELKIVGGDGYRYYTDTATETIVIPITTTAETLENYKKLILDVQTQPAKNTFKDLPRVSMYVGQPDTGKTYKALQLAKSFGIDPLLIMCRDTLNLETLFEDFILVDGKPAFQESLAIQMLSDPNEKEYCIVLDEANTLLTGTMKTLQPILDDTSDTFVYRGKIYKKNLNCKIILTLNDKDKGISVVPDAILSRCHITYFEPVPLTTLSKWTGAPVAWITNLFNIYKVLGILNIFGSRQIKSLYNKRTPEEIENHLHGLCMMRNIDPKILKQVEIKTHLLKL